MTKQRFTIEQLKDLAGVLLKTSPAELTCDEWLNEIAPYAEAVMTGHPPPANAPAVEHHLSICPECKEEFEALLATLRREKQN